MNSKGLWSGLASLSLLAKVVIAYNKGNLGECHKNLVQILKENPRAPSDLWFALGLVYYRAKNLIKAKLSFEKTLALDENNSMALVALGILEIAVNVNDFEVREKAAQLFERAFKSNPRNALAVKYLADHYFFKNDLEGAKKLA